MEFSLYVFSLGSFLLIGFSIHMFLINIGNTYLNKFLAVMMLIRGGQMIYFIAVNSGMTIVVSLLFRFLGPFLFLFGPVLYMYIRGYIYDQSQFQNKDLIHFFPLLFGVIDSFPIFFLNNEVLSELVSKIISEKAFFINHNFGLFPPFVSSLIRNGSLLIYFILVWKIIFKSRIILNRRRGLVLTNWILFFALITTLSNLNLLINSLINISIGASASNLFLNNYRVYIQSFILLVFFVYLFYNPKILYGFVFVSKEFALDKPKNAVIEDVVLNVDNFFGKEQSEKRATIKKQISNKNQEDIDNIKRKIIHFMHTSKPFLNHEFCLRDLAIQVDLPSHHCSYILNEYFEMNFREWVNGYRVDYFISQYPKLISSQTIVSIALASGFKNKNTFYNAFEKVTGQSPSKYFDDLSSFSN